jgi:hypothetical protein
MSNQAHLHLRRVLPHCLQNLGLGTHIHQGHFLHQEPQSQVLQDHFHPFTVAEFRLFILVQALRRRGGFWGGYEDVLRLVSDRR